MNLHHRVHIFIIKIWEQNDFLFNGIAISNKAELRFPYTGQVMDFTPDYSIGCHCLTQNGYKFGKKDLSAEIELNHRNIQNMCDYYADVLNGTEYTLIFEQRVSKYYWEKRQRIMNNWSVHTREVEPVYKIVTLDRLCNIMAYILFLDEKSEKEISKIIIDPELFTALP